MLPENYNIFNSFWEFEIPEDKYRLIVKPVLLWPELIRQYGLIRKICIILNRFKIIKTKVF